MKCETDCKAFEVVQREIFRMYSDHTLKPGDCVYETVMAEKFDLSRTPVRDALGRLVANGFLEQHRGKRGYMMPRLTNDDMHDAFEEHQWGQTYTIDKKANLSAA